VAFDGYMMFKKSGTVIMGRMALADGNEKEHGRNPMRQLDPQGAHHERFSTDNGRRGFAAPDADRTNWFLGFSHTTAAKDAHIQSLMDRSRIADVLEVFLKSGVDAVMGLIQRPLLHDAIQDAQDRTAGN